MKHVSDHWMKALLFGGLFALLSFSSAFGQGSAAKAPQALPKVSLVSETSIKEVMQAKGRPLLVNFWATWCDPCREEFPDLVKLDNEFKGKIDFITISLDDPEDINTAVPRFLSSVKASMPAYLLKTADESAVISSISKEWQGGMPFTILYDKDGKPVYEKEGKVKLEIVRPKIAELVAGQK